MIDIKKFDNLHYFSPEILHEKKTSCCSDMFSLGTILFYLIAGYPPFKKADIEDEQYKTMMCNRSDIFYIRKRALNFSDEIKVLLDALFELRELQRPSI